MKIIKINNKGLGDKKAFLFYFFMTIIFLDFGKSLEKLSFTPLVNQYFNQYLSKEANPLFSIVHVNNSGIAFGMLQNGAAILAGFGLFIIALFTIYVYKYVSFKDKLTLLSITLFCAGTLGNTIERIKFGYVIDFIKLNFIDFPVFNAYDIMICIGIVLYLFAPLPKIKTETEKTNNNNNNNIDDN